MELETIIFELISQAGNAKSMMFEALDEIKNGHIEKSRQIMKEASTELNKAHNAQTKLIQSEINGDKVDVSLLLIHAQDHLMSAVQTEDMIQILIEQQSQINELKKGRE